MGGRGDVRPQHGDVDPGPHHVDGLRRLVTGVQAGDHAPQLGHDVRAEQAAAGDAHHRAVSGSDDGHGGGLVFDEEQRGALAADRLADRLGQRAGGVQLRDQDDVLEPVPAQALAELGGIGVVGPGHADGRQAVATLGGAVPGSEDGVQHLLRRTGHCRLRDRGDADGVVVKRDSVSVLALYQHHADRRGCHRHAQYDVH